MDEIRLLIAGSRDFTDYEMMKEKVSEMIAEIRKSADYKENTRIIIISGGADGADTLAKKLANNYYFDFELYKANWKLYGRKAGHIRNSIMAYKANYAALFWDGESRGTLNMINQLKRKGDVTYKVYLFGDAV